MKWLTFDDGWNARHGYLDGDTIVVVGDGDLSGIVAGETPGAEVDRIPLDGARILAPLLRPGKVLAVAANYQSHVTEGGDAERDVRTASPRLFLKPDTAIIGPDAPVELDPITRELDWEAELAVVIGRRARRVSVADALGHVFGYATSNDISARSLAIGCGGVPAGANNPLQETMSKPGTVSPIVGRSGNRGERLGPVTASTRSFPALICASIAAPPKETETSPVSIAVVTAEPPPL